MSTGVAKEPISKCASCGAPIVWVVTKNGKDMPIDAEPVANGNIVVEDGKNAVYIGKHNTVATDEPRYVSHFATCPQAAQHRKAAQ